MEEEKIKKQAKELMDEFMKALEKIDDKEEVFGTERTESLGSPKAKKRSPDFRQKALKNAPATKDGHFVMEKKKW